MKALIQRVASASVDVAGKTIGKTGRGYLVLLGVTHGDTDTCARKLAAKTLNLRVFEDEAGKMNLSVCDIGGEILVVSQFTLYADTRKGNRPSFINAAPPELAKALYLEYVEALRREIGVNRVATGEFGAEMKVSLLNDGPVTIELIVDS